MNLEESKSVSGPQDPQDTRRHIMGIYDWQRYFESATSVLKIERHIKGDTDIEYRMDATETMVQLSQKMVEELLRMGMKSLEKVEVTANGY